MVLGGLFFHPGSVKLALRREAALEMEGEEGSGCGGRGRGMKPPLTGDLEPGGVERGEVQASQAAGWKDRGRLIGAMASGNDTLYPGIIDFCCCDRGQGGWR